MRSRHPSWALPKSVDVPIHPREGRSYIRIESASLIKSGVCSTENATHVMFSIAMYITLLDDSPFGYGTKPRKLYLNFLRYLTTNPIKDVIVSMSSLADRCMTVPVLYGSSEDWDDILRQAKHLPIFRELLQYVREQSIAHFSYVITFLRFLKKIRYKNDELIPDALRKWNQVEDRLRSLVFDRDSQLIKLVKSFVTLFCQPISLTAEDCKFGPGHVAEPMRFFDPAHKLMSIRFKENAGRVVLGTCLRSKNPSRTGQEYLSHLTMRGISSLVSDDPVAAPAVAKVKFVDKDVGAYRTICMEPSGHMFLQQGLLRSVSSVMKKTMWRFVTLDDQLGNQMAAQFGSSTGLVDTIDLSAASDSVHVDLVRMVFPKNWLYYLLGTRTNKVRLPTGDVVKVNKFAPMGSALCFPIQCILFTAISLASIAMTEAKSHDTPDEFISDVLLNPQGFIDRSILYSHATSAGGKRGVYFPLTVYGDDIIIDTRATPVLLENLRTLGFIPNDSKSFQGGQAVRESCGEYYLRGETFTPLTLKVKWLNKSLEPAVYSSIVSFANQSNLRGYLNLRSFAIRFLRMCTRSGKSFPPAFTADPDKFGIYTPNLSKDGSRYSPDIPDKQNYQREEYPRLTVQMKIVREYTIYHDHYSYHLHQMRDEPARDGEAVEPHLVARADSLRFTVRWTPL